MDEKRKKSLPATTSKLVSSRHLRNINANNSLTQTLANLSEDLGVLEVGSSLNNSTSTLLGVTRLEDTRANEDTVAAQLHHQCRISGSSNTPSGEVNNGQTALLSTLTDKLVGGLKLTGISAQLRLRVSARLKDTSSTANLGIDSAHVLNGLNDITGTGLTLGADHSSTLGDTAKGLAQVAAATDEGDLEGGLGNVVDIVGGGQNFRLIDIVDTNGLEDLCNN